MLWSPLLQLTKAKWLDARGDRSGADGGRCAGGRARHGERSTARSAGGTVSGSAPGDDLTQAVRRLGGSIPPCAAAVPPTARSPTWQSVRVGRRRASLDEPAAAA